jgi:hypothetical protein
LVLFGMQNWTFGPYLALRGGLLCVHRPVGSRERAGAAPLTLLLRILRQRPGARAAAPPEPGLRGDGAEARSGRCVARCCGDCCCCGGGGHRALQASRCAGLAAIAAPGRAVLRKTPAGRVKARAFSSPRCGAGGKSPVRPPLMKRCPAACNYKQPLNSPVACAVVARKPQEDIF